jgi:hypothetical protein
MNEKSTTPVQVTVPVTVADPVCGLKWPTGSTVTSTTGGGGAVSTTKESVPPFPVPSSWSSNARMV